VSRSSGHRERIVVFSEGLRMLYMDGDGKIEENHNSRRDCDNIYVCSKKFWHDGKTYQD
jgi:hypothetical protein